jgi:membrane fusion protein, heavy metal efflux system
MIKRLQASAAPWLLLGLACALPACSPKAGGAPLPAYKVGENTVTVSKDSPIHFSVSLVEAGDPLPLNPVTARVTTVEALTSPSFAPLSGRVVEAAVRPGDHVKEGQKLVQVRTADLAALEHDVHAAELGVETRSASVGRLRALVASRAASENDLLLAESELEQAKLTLKTARSRLSSLQVQRADDTTYWVLATRSGVVVQLDATPGLQVGPERGSPVATVANLTEVLVVGDVPQRDAVDLTVGAATKIYPAGPSSPPIAGVIEAISEVVDVERQTVPVRVRVDNAERKLRPNAYVDLELGTAKKQSIVLVPSGAVVRDGADAVVFVQKKPGHFERRAVRLGRQGRDRVEITSGLLAGEEVVTTSALLLLNAIDIQG